MANNNQRQSRNESLTDRLPVKLAIIFGAIAFVLVFVLVAGFLEVDGMISDEDIEVNGDDGLDTDEEPGFLTPRGWAFFSAHFVDLEASATTPFGEVGVSIDTLDEATDTIPSWLFYPIPILILTAAGFLLANRSLERIHTERDGAIFGASIVMGYLPASLVAVLVFSWHVETDEALISYEIPLVEGLLLAGLLFPIAFGAIGGYFAFTRST